MEQKIEREWNSIRCRGGKDKTLVMVEWKIVSEKGRILKKDLRLLDCRHPHWAQWGGGDCQWGCEKVIEKSER